MKNMNKSIEKMSFEEALLELKEIASKADSGEISLDKAIESFERGAQLKKHCDKILKESTLKIEKIVEDMDGNVSVQAIEIE
jgi:exodeoxyribonuclease VII small subunit